jgi:hypothetical protein
MAYYFLRDTKFKYIGLDLPENIALQSYYLKSMFPDKDFLLFGDPCLKERLNSHSFDIALLPSFCIEYIESDSVDVSFNSYSLAEMTWPAIDNYLQQLGRITKSFFYHVNHTVWRVSADEFRFDPRKFRLLLRFPTMWGRDRKAPTLDHHDFLYKRIQVQP